MVIWEFLLQLTHSLLRGYNIHPPSNVFVGLAFTQLIGHLLFKIAALLDIRQNGKWWIHKPGPTEDNDDDDWELYEEGALIQQRVAEMERETNLGGRGIDNEPANGIISLSTYGVRYIISNVHYRFKLCGIVVTLIPVNLPTHEVVISQFSG